MKVDVYYTGGGIWLAEMNLENGTYAVVNSECDTIISIYKYPEEGEEQYMAEDMILSDDVKNLDSNMAVIYKQLHEELQKHK